MSNLVSESLPSAAALQRAEQLFRDQLDGSRRRTDRMFAWLMGLQWPAGIAAALIISPRTWEGSISYTHIHVWAAVFLGGVISGLPLFLALRFPGAPFTRHIVAVGQMLTSALWIHLTGGRIETHFHIFGSLAFLAFYLDWRVLVTATIVVGIDHSVRGIFWPQSVFGVLTASPWRWVEHAAWVLFEDVFLILSIRQGLAAMMGVAVRQAQLEGINEVIEQTVSARTHELTVEIAERKKAERQVNLEYVISRIMAESTSAESGSQKVIEAICESLRQNIGALWVVDHREGVLRCKDVWRTPGDGGLEAFVVACQEMAFAKGVGLPGRVWASEESVFVFDVVADRNFPRAKAAAKANLHGAFAFPIIGSNGISGVMEFFGPTTEAPDPGLLRICANIGRQLGRFFELKRVQDHLFQSQKMETVGKMAGGIAHEFNSIMTAIIGQSEMLAADLPPDSPLGANAHEIGQAAERAATLTRQLLAYGRKQIMRPQTLNLNDVVVGMTETLHHILGDATDLRMIPGADLKAVRADIGQIEQVILNIAMNAADAMPNGGKLTLEMMNISLQREYASRVPELRPGNYVLLAISDTGFGMSEEIKARAFEPFFTTKDVGKGTGLGLATCHGIIKQSHGHISLYSELSRGTTVKIYLPVAQDEAKPAPAFIEPLDLPRGTETVLVVEDDPALREMSVSMLRRLGYKVFSANDGVEALRVSRQNGVGHIDLLFTDVVMPQMDGKELADRVRMLHPKTRILFTSAYTENSIVHQGVLRPGIVLLAKPFSRSALARKIREVLDQDHELLQIPQLEDSAQN